LAKIRTTIDIFLPLVKTKHYHPEYTFIEFVGLIVPILLVFLLLNVETIVGRLKVVD